jgi:TrmH RNA methyltransferase
VAEVFKAAPDRVERLYFDGDNKAQVQTWCAHLARRRKVYRQVGPDEMQRVAGTAMHGGVVALVHPRPVRDLDLTEAAAWAAAGKSLLILDGVGNPQNIGAIARTAGFFGVEHIAFTGHPAQAGLSDASYRVAKGALEHIGIHRIANTAETLRRLGQFYTVVGTAVGRGKDVKEIDRRGRPIALVMGNEEVGLEAATLAACNAVVTLSGSAKVQSLNVSAAAAILVHGLLAQS